jgi:hypothetical protein
MAQNLQLSNKILPASRDDPRWNPVRDHLCGRPVSAFPMARLPRLPYRGMSAGHSLMVSELLVNFVLADV